VGAWVVVVEVEDFAAAAAFAVALRAGGFVSGLLVAMAFTPCEWRVSHPYGGLPAFEKECEGYQSCVKLYDDFASSKVGNGSDRADGVPVQPNCPTILRER
jgi:hypothetical protein